ncbi:hypothetical protein [Streptomyces sp. KL116D]
MLVHADRDGDVVLTGLDGASGAMETAVPAVARTVEDAAERSL